MANYKIVIEGFEITANSAADVAELVRTMTAKEVTVPSHMEAGIPRRARRVAHANEDSNAGSRSEKNAIPFLEAIATHQEVGSPKMQKVLNVGDPKGMGPITRGINALIEKHGFALNEVYTTQRDRNGRTWNAGPKIDDAIRSIKEAK